jgi:hypothetical protein
MTALEFLEELDLTEPVEYSLVPGAEIVVIPTRLFAKLSVLLSEGEVSFTEVPVVPMSELPPEEQAKRRGFLRKHPEESP